MPPKLGFIFNSSFCPHSNTQHSYKATEGQLCKFILDPLVIRFIPNCKSKGNRTQITCFRYKQQNSITEVDSRIKLEI
jgi:hypothetical protein